MSSRRQEISNEFKREGVSVWWEGGGEGRVGKGVLIIIHRHRIICSGIIRIWTLCDEVATLIE